MNKSTLIFGYGDSRSISNKMKWRIKAIQSPNSLKINIELIKIFEEVRIVD